MARILWSIMLIGLCAGAAVAQQSNPAGGAQKADTTVAQPASATDPAKGPPPPEKKESVLSRMYFGGTVGVSFGDYFRIAVQPWAGYRLTPKFSVGGKLAYEYVEDDRYSQTLTSHNYGASAFSRYRVIPPLYAHAEFAYMSYKYKISDLESDREWVPFLLLGGGYVQSIGPNSSFFVEVLVDVLQSDKSPYKDWEPFISVGAAVGF